MEAAVNSNTALPKVTVAAVASSAASWVATTSRAVAVATATRQAAVPVVLTRVLRLRIPTSHPARHPKATALTLVPLIRARRRRAMARNTVPPRRKALARSMVLHRRASVLKPGLTTRPAATTDSRHMAVSNQVVSEVSNNRAPTVVRHLSTAATVKAAMAANLVATNSLRVDIHKAATAARLLPADTAAVVTSSRMATAVMEDDLVGHGFGLWT
jgi:hypothetical protein